MDSADTEIEKEPACYGESSNNEFDVVCNKWDVDCKVVNVPYDGIRFTGYHHLSNDVPAEPQHKRSKANIDINESYTDPAFIKGFKECWENKNMFSFRDSELKVDPFRVCILKNFLEDKTFLSKVKEEFYEVEWHKRNMDLYEFFQSSDLKHLESFKSISLLYTFLKDTVMKWVSKLTGLELVKISATCSLYGDTDYLLVHDDQQDDRMVAFILYLMDSEDWKIDYGGGLQLFNKNSEGQPFQVVEEILPSHNQFIFFQVGDDTYHQVSEITCKNDCRLSINGWFHSKENPIFETPLYCPPSSGIFSKNVILPQLMDVDISDWISEEYLNNGTAEQIQAHIEENSEISLCNFFKQSLIQALLEDLGSDYVKWQEVGPPNRFSYSRLEEKNLPQVLERFLLLFTSNQMFELLKQYTDLDLKSVKYEMQKWTTGCYMLLSDYDWLEKNELDLVLYLGCSNSGSVVGGRTVYIATDDEIQQALVTIEPQENNLNIIFRDSARFTKYVSKYSKCKCFYMFICSYSE